MEGSSATMPINKQSQETNAKVSNEDPNVKIIKLSEAAANNLDPLEYFSRFLGIPEMILMHLDGKDVLTASEVTPSYYNFIASLTVLMKKIEVVCDRDLNLNGEDLVRIPEVGEFEYNFFASSLDLLKTKIGFHDRSTTQLEDFNLLKNSSRLYQNIKIKRWKVKIDDENENSREFGDYITDSELDFFYSKAHEWKNVSLANVYFRNKQDLWRLLSAIESSVESISVWENGVLPFEDPSSEIESVEALKFPKLKQLTVRLYDFHTFVANSTFVKTLARFLLNSVAIEVLDLQDFSGKIDIDILTKMLGKFDKLRSLSLQSTIVNQLFEDESWKKFQFKLKSLAILNIGQILFGTNFVNFFKSQSNHLEKLGVIAHAENTEIFDVIMKMPKLKSLSLYCVGFFENEVPTNMSTSITELTLIKCNNNAVCLKFMLDSMPKVTNLTLQSIDEEEFKILKTTKRKFENLKVRGELKGVDIKELEEIMIENYTSLEIANKK